MKTAVMTFDPHPREVIGKGRNNVSYLMPLDVKAEQIKKLGIDTLYVVKFNEQLAKLSPNAFVKNYILDLNVKHVVAGFDYTYGYQKVSSTLIRTLIKRGAVHQIPQYLGSHYEIRGKIINIVTDPWAGQQWAEVELYQHFTIPTSGIYNIEKRIHGHTYSSKAFVYPLGEDGTRFSINLETSPSHVKTLYHDVEIRWLHRIGSVNRLSHPQHLLVNPINS